MISSDTRHPTPNIFMQRALELARAQLGQTWPNPAVGAVVVRDNRIVGEGATAKGGRPHAETIALAQAGEFAKGATLYVTLEPCSHHGKTPPCVGAIIAAGITQIVIACLDANPLVDGITALRAAGIKVREELSAEAHEINRGFFSAIERNRPFIAMKIATSSDGKIAYPPHPYPLPVGKREKWITSLDAREHGQKLRAEFDAILTGIGTVLTDDPLLTVRIPGLEHRSPVRIVLDRQGRMPKDSKLMQTTNEVPVWIFNQPLEEVIQIITQKGITRLLVEAGQGINTAFLKAGLVDRLYWYKAPKVMGESGLPAVSGADIAVLLNDWQKVGDVLPIDNDYLTILEKGGSPPNLLK